MKTLITAAALAVSSQLAAQNLESAAEKIWSANGITAAWARSITGQGVTVGVIDQGFDLGHADFAGKIVQARNFYSSGAVTWGSHGTAMAGIIAANSNQAGSVGVAPSAKLVLAQVGPGGTNTMMQERAIYQALDWTSQQSVAAINMSFGADYTTSITSSMIRNPTTGIYFAGSSALSMANPAALINNYKVATDRGVILVAAAGNQGLPYSEFPGMYATRTGVNGELVLGGRMIVVGSVDSNNNIASFSNRAGHICQNSTNRQCLDPVLTRDYFVVAPGLNIPTTSPRATPGLATTSTGTSASAAYVTGGIALIKQAWPLLQSQQIVNLLLSTTRDLGAPGTDSVYGRGLVDFDRATRPQGQLTIARPTTNLTTKGFVGLPVTASMASFPTGIALKIRSTSVVQNSQVIDELGRNYRADLSQAILPRSQLGHSPESPWLAQLGLQEIMVDRSQNWIMRVFNNTNGAAVQNEWLWSKFSTSLQLGTQVEYQGYLGMRGQGSMDLGSSQTQWAILGIEYPLTNNWTVQARYGRAQTQVTNSQLSMFVTDPKISSHAWNLAVRRDNLVMALGIPVSVRSGSVEINSVTDYNYRKTQEGLVAEPVVSRQKVSLKMPVQEYNLYTNYRQFLTKQSWINYNMQYRFNQGGSNTNSLLAGVNFTWTQ